MQTNTSWSCEGHLKKYKCHASYKTEGEINLQSSFKSKDGENTEMNFSMNGG